MNRLVLIGNGFDLAHGLKTSYKDFIYWYWKQRVQSLRLIHQGESDDGLCICTIYGYSTWYEYYFLNSAPFDLLQRIKTIMKYSIIYMTIN